MEDHWVCTTPDGKIKVWYSTTSFSGDPLFTVQDSTEAKNFIRNENIKHLKTKDGNWIEGFEEKQPSGYRLLLPDLPKKREQKEPLKLSTQLITPSNKNPVVLSCEIKSVIF